MRNQPFFMKLKHQANEQSNQNPFNLEFNDEHFAIATPEFWDAWNADKNRTRGRAISRQFTPAKYRADQVGQKGQKPVWVVFKNLSAKEALDEKLATPSTPLAAEQTIKGLAWQSTKANGGMFLDDRNETVNSRSPVVAWLNYNRGIYSVNVVSDTFQLNRPIPRSITELGKAVEWVYKNSVWRSSEGGTS